MENLQESSVCLVCSGNADNIHDDSNFNSETFPKFLRFVSRYLSYGHSSFNNNNFDQFLATHKSPRFNLIKCCDICAEHITKFFEMYEAFELIQLELFNTLDHISTVMLKSCPGNKTQEVADFQVAFATMVEEKRTQHFPVVKIKRLETHNIKNDSINLFEDETVSHLSVSYLNSEHSSFEDDQFNVEDSNFNFETSSKTNKTDPLELSNNDPNPLSLKIEQDKIDNDAKGNDHHHNEEKIFNSRESSPNNGKLARKLPPKRGIRRVKDKELTCVFCSKKQQNRQSLQTHLLSHIEERPHQCKKCFQEYRSKNSFREHLIRGDNRKEKSCQRWSRRRLRSKFELTCLFCSKKFTSRNSIRMHTLAHTEERPYHCKICLQEYRFKKYRREHLMKIHNPNYEKPETIRDKLCPICGKLFTSVLAVESHISYVHEKVRNFKCDYENCSKAFFAKADLTRHQKVHTDLRPFECNICHKSFNLRFTMTTHKVSVHNEEGGTEINCVRCTVCKKRFRAMSLLRLHRARFHPDLFKEDRESLMKYKCPHAPCDKAFFTNSHLKLHLERKCHGNVT